jgi:putative hydrolase of the HAD superfamily
MDRKVKETPNCSPAIDTVVFDIGNVILRYQPLKELEKQFSPEIAKQIFDTLFNSHEWEEFDRGAISEEELLALCIAQTPELKNELILSMRCYYDFLSPLPETCRCIAELKEKGYKLYILSNVSVKAFTNVFERYDIFSLFHGRMLSAEEKINKPAPAIFERLIEKFNINLNQTLFIDDMLKNIHTAERMGFQTIHLVEPENIREELQQLGIRL